MSNGTRLSCHRSVANAAHRRSIERIGTPHSCRVMFAAVPTMEGRLAFRNASLFAGLGAVVSENQRLRLGEALQARDKLGPLAVALTRCLGVRDRQL